MIKYELKEGDIVEYYVKGLFGWKLKRDIFNGLCSLDTFFVGDMLWSRKEYRLRWCKIVPLRRIKVHADSQIIIKDHERNTTTTLDKIDIHMCK